MVRSSFFDIPYFVPSERFACAPPFSCKYFPINRICTKTTRFLCFSNPLLHSILGHISRRVASRYTLSSRFHSQIFYNGNCKSTNRKMIFLPIFLRRVWYLMPLQKRYIDINAHHCIFLSSTRDLDLDIIIPRLLSL